METKKEKLDRIFTENCLKKSTFYEYNRALVGAKKVKKTWGMATKPYKCQFCGLYHLTTSMAPTYSLKKS